MTNNPMDKACPNLVFDGIITDWNTLITTSEGWMFWEHQTPNWPDGRKGKIERVQFCKLIGRKKDVFECINENEWHDCPHVRLQVTGIKADD